MTTMIDQDAPMFSRTVSSPLGALTLLAGGEVLRGVYFEEHRPLPRVKATSVGTSDALDAAAAALEAYFADARHPFALPLAALGTSVERAVWAELARIPAGETRTYGAIARAIGRPSAARAVGSAVARNPLSIVVPCHRVLGADGSLTGFAGGLARKRWLLAHEGAL